MASEPLHVRAERLEREMRWIWPVYLAFWSVCFVASLGLLVWTICLLLKA